MQGFERDASRNSLKLHDGKTRGLSACPVAFQNTLRKVRIATLLSRPSKRQRYGQRCKYTERPQESAEGPRGRPAKASGHIRFTKSSHRALSLFGGEFARHFFGISSFQGAPRYTIQQSGQVVHQYDRFPNLAQSYYTRWAQQMLGDAVDSAKAKAQRRPRQIDSRISDLKVCKRRVGGD